MAFAGDVHFEDYLAPRARDPHGLDELQTSLGAADLAMVNLETAITERGTKIGKEFHFRAPASALETIKNAGIDAVSMANNHGVDYGPVGLDGHPRGEEDEPRADRRHRQGRGRGVRAGDPVGQGAQGRGVRRVRGLRDDPGPLLGRPRQGRHRQLPPRRPAARRCQQAAAKYDVVVVFLHWGLDYQTCPDRLSVQTAEALEEAGADIIVGGHSHRVNGAGWLGRSYVDYGFGNFVWWRSREPDSRSGVLTLSIDVKRPGAPSATQRSVVRKAVWTPMLIGADGIPRSPTPRQRTAAHALEAGRRVRHLATASASDPLTAGMKPGPPSFR